MKIQIALERTFTEFPRLARSIRIPALMLATLLALGAPRIDAAGSHLVHSFSGDGKMLFNVSGKTTDAATAVFNNFDGKFLVAGYTDSGDSDFLLIRLNADGSLDTAFNNTGWIATEFGSNDAAYALALQSDGKIVVVGNSGQNWAVARYNQNGTLDNSFSGDGKVAFSFEGFVGPPNSIALSSGKIVVAGTVRSLSTNALSWGLARLNSDGTLDSTFNGDGRRHHEFGGFQAMLSKLAGQPDGKMIGAGAIGGASRNYLIARFNSDGSFDTTFNNTGLITTDFNGGDDSATRIRLLGNDKYIVSGTRRFGDYTTASITLARYNSNGSLDTTFNNDGKMTIEFLVDGYETMVDMAITDGKINLLGYTDHFAAFSLFRFNEDGTRDATFGTGGRVNTVFGPGNPQEINTIPGGVIGFGSDNVIVVGRYERSVAVARLRPQGIAVGADFSGNGHSELNVFRPSEGNWYSFELPVSTSNTTKWGQAGDLLAHGDYDGDGRADHAIFRGGIWYILKSSDSGFIISQFGLPGDKPVPGDYDGDGKTDLAVYRPSDGVWHMLRSTHGYTAAAFGLAEDKPVPGDYDGDGLNDLAVFRPSTGVWYLMRTMLGFTAVSFGLSEDRPVQGDYDADGRTDIVVFRPSAGVWHLLLSSQRNAYVSAAFGLPTDIPAPISINGHSVMTVFRPSNGVWYLWDGGGGVTFSWGTNGDIPISSSNIPQ